MNIVEEHIKVKAAIRDLGIGIGALIKFAKADKQDPETVDEWANRALEGADVIIAYLALLEKGAMER